MLILAKFAKDKPAVLGGLIVLIVVAIAMLAPLLAPYPGDVSASHLLKRLKPPSWEHPFGTDNLGRDILSPRVILGARGALTIALMVVGISMAIGVPLGLMAGYSHGWVSEAIVRSLSAGEQLLPELLRGDGRAPLLDVQHADAVLLHPGFECLHAVGHDLPDFVGPGEGGIHEVRGADVGDVFVDRWPPSSSARSATRPARITAPSGSYR